MSRRCFFKLYTQAKEQAVFETSNDLTAIDF